MTVKCWLIWNVCRRFLLKTNRWFCWKHVFQDWWHWNMMVKLYELIDVSIQNIISMKHWFPFQKRCASKLFLCKTLQLIIVTFTSHLRNAFAQSISKMHWFWLINMFFKPKTSRITVWTIDWFKFLWSHNLRTSQIYFVLWHYINVLFQYRWAIMIWNKTGKFSKRLKPSKFTCTMNI